VTASTVATTKTVIVADDTAFVRDRFATALLGAGIQVQSHSGLFFGFKGESQLGAGTTILTRTPER